MVPSHALLPLLPLLSVLPHLSAHGSHDQAPLTPPDADWATRHMAEEHHVANVAPLAFFLLHDYNGDGMWSKEEVRRTYGLDDESMRDVVINGEGVGEEKKVGTIYFLGWAVD